MFLMLIRLEVHSGSYPEIDLVKFTNQVISQQYSSSKNPGVNLFKLLD